MRVYNDDGSYYNMTETRTQIDPANLQEILDAEVWKPVPSLRHTSASSFGAVRNDRTGRIYSQYNNVGYLSVKVAGMRRQVHRLVMEAHIGLSELMVNHKDGNKRNNRLENLEYCTNQHNIQHAYDIGLFEKAKKMASERLSNLHAMGLVRYAHGTKHRLAKLDPDKVRSIRASTKSQQTLAKEYGVSREVIRAVKNKITWKHVN